MKKNFFFLFFLLGIAQLYSQNLIAIQSFETSGDNWTPITFSTPPCTNGDDIWDYTTNLPGISSSHGSQFWGVRDLNGNCGGNNFESISLSNIDVSSFTDVIFSFDYYAISFENDDAIKYELFFDNISQGEVIVIDGSSNNSVAWSTETISIPDSVTNVSVIISVKNNDNNDRGGLDFIRLYEGVGENCTNAISLVVGETNTENIVTGSFLGVTDSGELPEPSCGNYRGGDLWYTADVPASGLLTIETLVATSGVDTSISVYTGSCGFLSEIYCDDNSGTGQLSLVNISNLPNTTVYIRVWDKNNNNFGDVDIVAYSLLCPFSTIWDGLNWNNGLPNLFTSAIFNADYDTSINGNIESCNCTINTLSTVNVTANNFLSVTNDLNVDGILEVQNEGSLVMIQDDGVINSTGIINIHKTTSPFNQYDYIYWSSPTENETVGSALASSEQNRIYQWNNINGWLAAGGTTTMEQGVGIIAMGPTTGTFPQLQSVIFDGIPNTGIIETPIAKNPDPLYTYLDWNLIGNPYPSALDARLFLDDQLNSSIVNGSIYLWTHNTQLSSENPGSGKYNYSSNDYASFTSGTGGVAAISGGPVPSGYIASGQGFFIQAASSGNATFNNSMRTIDNNDQFFKSNNYYQNKDRIWLNLSNDKGAFSQILIGFISGATDGIDRSYDGPKFGGSYISFYSIVDEKNLAIQGRSPIKDKEVIKLGLYSYIEQNDDLKISIDKIEGVLSEYDIYLFDKLLNIVHDLRIDDYTFVPEEQGIYNERFELGFVKSNTLSLDENLRVNDNLILINNESGVEIKTNNNKNIAKLKIYTILGKSIANLKPSSNRLLFDSSNIPNGTVLIINATLENGSIINKKFIVY